MKNLILEVGDFIESYSLTTNGSIQKFVVTEKIVTKSKGIFYDIMSIEREYPCDLKSINLKPEGNLHYRKLTEQNEK